MTGALTAVVWFSLVAADARAQQKSQSASPTTTVSVTNAKPSDGVDAERIIRTMAAKESEFARARNQYTYKRDAVFQSIGMGQQISGEYRRVSRFVFDDAGKLYEKILLFPLPTIKDLEITLEDLEELSGSQGFVLDESKLKDYNFAYAGKEKIDELNLYVFDVTPKVIPDPKKSKQRFFKGRIWVDDQDFQIVKLQGKGVPEGKQRYPVVETYREQVDGKYWFPTYSYADEDLVFPDGNVAHVRSRVRFTEYERARGKVRIIEDESVVGDQDTQAKPKPSSTPPAKIKP